MPFSVALSGLNAANTDLQVIGNNIANVNTIGYKFSRANFADVFNLAFNDTFGNKAGAGVRTASIAQQFTQGSLEFTGNGLDLAMNGNGLFVLNDPSTGTDIYTRAGSFFLDRDSNVVNSFDQRLQAFPVVDATIPSFNTSSTVDLQLPNQVSNPSATTEVDIQFNLPGDIPAPLATPIFDPTDTSTFNESTSVTVYDSLGIEHTATLFFTQTDIDLEWEVNMTIDGDIVGAGQTIVYDDTGVLDAAATAAIPTTLPLTFAAYPVGNGAADLNIVFDIEEYGPSTQQDGGSFSVDNLNQNGFTLGRFVSLDISDTGVIQSRFSNGEVNVIGQIALADFNNLNGLRPLGDTAWAETFSSGDRRFGVAGSSGFGGIVSGALEASNVDLSAQLVKLIVAQRNYQANAQTISAEDTILQSVLNL